MSRESKHRAKGPDAPPPADPADRERAPDAAEAPAEKAPAAGDALAAMTAERDDLLARLQRVSADYMNYQKRVQRDIEQARAFANEELIKALLGVLDDMERALEAGRANHDEDDPFLIGMQLVHDKALETLGKFGVTVIEAEGKPFDPELQSAMMQQPSGDCPPGTVLKELARGYRLKGRTIRPSAVVVSTEPTDAPADDEAGEKPQA